jgi:hypothetical protein
LGFISRTGLHHEKKKNISSIHLSGEKVTNRSPSFQLSSSDISFGW